MRPLSRLEVRTLCLGFGFFLAAGITASTAHAQMPSGPPWVAKANMNTPRLSHASVALDGKIVVIGGVSGGRAIAEVEMYDPMQDRWTALPPLPEPRVNHGAALCRNGQIIVAGGFDDAASTQLSEEAFAFDPQQNQWRRIADPPVRRGSPGMAQSDDEPIVFLAGGAPALATVDAYDCMEDRWRAMPGMITGRQKPGVIFIEAELYVMGGRTTDNPNVPNAQLNVVEALNFRGEWETRARMPTARSDFAVINLGDEFGIAVGGTDGRGPLATVEIYGVDANRWSPAAPLPMPARGGAGASFPFDTMGFFTGGSSTEPAMPSARLVNFRALLDPRLRGAAFDALRGEDDADDD
jgi:hypothetical protein